MTCLYVLPLFLERAHLHSPLCQLLSPNFKRPAHLLCLNFISYFLELLSSLQRRKGGEEKEKETINKMQVSSSVSQYLSAQIGRGRACSWEIGGFIQTGDELYLRHGTSSQGTALCTGQTGWSWNLCGCFHLQLHALNIITLVKNTYDKNWKKLQNSSLTSNA